jgi:hypothetical protein
MIIYSWNKIVPFLFGGVETLRYPVAPYVSWVMYSYSAVGQCFTLRIFYYFSQESLYMLSWHKWYRLVCLDVLCTVRKLAWARKFFLLVACVTYWVMVGWWLFPMLRLDGFTYADVVFGSIVINHL